MSKQQYFLVSVIEWGIDHEPMNLRQTETLRKDGWRLPSLEEFKSAMKARLKGFTDPNDTYWASAGSGDIAACVPDVPDDWAICNRRNVENRLRMIRRLSNHAITSDVRSKITKAQLIGK